MEINFGNTDGRTDGHMDGRTDRRGSRNSYLDVHIYQKFGEVYVLAICAEAAVFKLPF